MKKLIPMGCLLATLAGLPLGAVAGAFTPGNLAVLSPDSGAAADTTFSIVEINASTLGQGAAVQTIGINGTTMPTALHMGTSATSGGFSTSADGTLLTFPGYNTNNTANTATLQRGVGTLSAAGAYAMPATYLGVNANQTRGVTTVDNQHFYWADKGGIYTNASAAPCFVGNVLRIKSFGTRVYVLNASGLTNTVSIWNPGSSTLTSMSGIPTAADANAKDFYLISSGANGASYDILYQIDNTSGTAGTIFKYSLVSGSWVANGTYTTAFGGCGICAAKSGSGAVLYAVTGLGTAANNKVEKLTDAAGYNATISLTDNGTLFTAPGTSGFKDVAFVPAALTYSVTYNGNGNTGGTAPVDGAAYAGGATVTVSAGGSLARTGYTFAGWNTAANGTGTAYAASGTFAIAANTTLYAQWTLNSYLISYNGNGNSAGTAPAGGSYNYNTSITVSNQGTLVLSGASFTGWNTAVTGAGTGYAAGASLTVVSNTTLFAQWASTPTLTVTPNSLALGVAAVGGSSTSQSYTVSGANLGANNIVIGASAAQFKVSTDNVNFSSSLTLSPVAGAVANTPVFVQLNPDSQGSFSGSITNTSAGASEQDVAVSGTGANVPSVGTQGATNITATGASFNGAVTAANNAIITDRGFYYKTAPGVTTSDTKVSEGGSSVSGYTKAVTGLNPNQIYYYRAYAVNAVGTALDANETNFWTLASPPAAPLVGSPAATTLAVAIGSGDGNPSSTAYAIQEANSGKFVQANGALGLSAVYQTAAVWGAQTVTGLVQGTAYVFQVKAHNGAGVDTAYGSPVTASTTALPFTAGNLAVLSPNNGTAAETPFSVLEISPSTLNQNSPVQTIVINGTVGNPGTALRMGTSGTSGGLSSSADGTLLCFAGYNTTNTTGANTVLRGVGTLNSAGLFALPATYQGNGAVGNQTRSVTTVDNQHFYWADKGGIYTNGAAAPSDAQNILRIKSFGGTVYAINQQGFASVVSIVSPDASRMYAMPGFPTATDANAKDFYLISSGQNGSTFDILYQVDSTLATVGTIYKYSLVAGQWTANGSYSTAFGGYGICAAKSGGGAALYVVTGVGTADNNSIEKLSDTAGYNSPIAITDNGTLYTAPGVTSFKAVAFAPVSYSVSYNGNGNTAGSAPVDSASYGVNTSVTESGNTGNLSKSGSAFAGWSTSANGSGLNSSGGINFNITSNTTFYAQWLPANAAATNSVEITGSVTYTVDVTQVPFASVAAPYGYQWYFGSTPLANQTGASLTLANVQFTDSGLYSVVVSNTSGALPVVSNLMAALTVVDTHPPILSLPGTINATNGSGGMQVSFNPTATDAGTPSVSVVCSPASGSYFSPGVSLVSCFATDNAGNTASGSFLVNVVNTNASTNIVVNGRTYLPYSANLGVGTWVWIDADPTNGSPMRATQRLLGEREVTEKGLLFAGLGFSAVTPTINGNAVTYDYSAQSGKNTYTVGQLVNKYDPIVIGPDGLAYITDGHHTMAAYLLTNSPVHDMIPGFHRVAFGQIVENLAGQGTVNDAWWQARESENNAYLYGTNGDQLIFPGEPNYAASQPILPGTVIMPASPSEITNNGVSAMVNDNGRSLGWGVRQGVVPSAYDSGGNPIVGYANTAPDGTAINFVDFYWGDFFRNRVVWNNELTPTGNGDANEINAPLSFFIASANGIALAKSELYRDQNGRSLFDYTNLVTFINATTNANTVTWAKTALGNGLAAVGDTYHLYLRDDSTIAGDIIPSALSTNILHIDATAGMTVTQRVQNVKYLYVNMGAQLTTIFPDAFVTNSTLTFPAGTAQVSLNNTSDVSSATVISNGVCSVNGVLNSPVVTAAHGSTLKGDGTINGAVTVQSSATLTPGNSIGILTVNGPLTLAGTTVMEINKTGIALTNDLVTGITTLTFGGTLTVSASGDALTGGESFTLFTAAHYAGAFTATNLPTLAAGLHWDVSQLYVNGSIRVLGVGPVAANASYTRSPGVALLINISNLLTNVTDANGFAVSLVGAGSDGFNLLTTNGATLLNNGTFLYYSNSVTPKANDAFNYTVSDGHGSTNAGTVFITVNSASLNPFGQNNVALSLSSTNVTANFFGVPGYQYTVERSTNLTSGLGWLPVSTNVAPGNGLMQVMDNFQNLGIQVPPVPASVFYRLRYNP